MANPETKALVDQSFKIVLGIMLLSVYALGLTLLVGVVSLFF
jgi:cytochrome c biogenesis protein CcdA